MAVTRDKSSLKMFPTKDEKYEACRAVKRIFTEITSLSLEFDEYSYSQTRLDEIVKNYSHRLEDSFHLDTPHWVNFALIIISNIACNIRYELFKVKNITEEQRSNGFNQLSKISDYSGGGSDHNVNDVLIAAKQLSAWLETLPKKEIASKIAPAR